MFGFCCRGKDKEVRSGGPIPIRKKKYQSFKEVMGLGDLEPIVDLQISVPENKVEPIGKIASIIGCIGNADILIYYC